MRRVPNSGVIRLVLFVSISVIRSRGRLASFKKVGRWRSKLASFDRPEKGNELDYTDLGFSLEFS
jgi:hypothetical protein